MLSHMTTWVVMTNEEHFRGEVAVDGMGEGVEKDFDGVRGIMEGVDENASNDLEQSVYV